MHNLIMGKRRRISQSISSNSIMMFHLFKPTDSKQVMLHCINVNKQLNQKDQLIFTLTLSSIVGSSTNNHRDKKALQTSSLCVIIFQAAVQLINERNHIVFVYLHHRAAERVQPASSVHLPRCSVKHHSKLTKHLLPPPRSLLCFFFSLLRAVHAGHQVNISPRV